MTVGRAVRACGTPLDGASVCEAHCAQASIYTNVSSVTGVCMVFNDC